MASSRLCLMRGHLTQATEPVVALFCDCACRGHNVAFMRARWPDGPFRLEVLLYAFIASIVISFVSAVLGLARRIVPGV